VTQTAASAAARAPRVLLVDDEGAITAPMAHYFRQLGYTADVADEPELAGAFAALRRYDLAILDLRLTHWGGREGLAVLEEIRRTNPWTRVVLLSAHLDEESEAEARRRGVDAVLAKPMPLPSLALIGRGLVGGSDA
jgi:two-component system, NtrC family, response regulator GlrR